MATGVGVNVSMRCTTNAAAFSTQTDCQLAVSRRQNLVRNVVESEHEARSASRRQQAAQRFSTTRSFAGGSAARAFCAHKSHAINGAEYRYQ